ncbi:MAG: L-seryl-tRNA(Sec) selenium transferase [Pseudomonadota bacterium]
MPPSRSPLATLPAVDRLLRQPRVAALPRPMALRAVREVIEEARARVLAEGAAVPAMEALAEAVEARVAAWRQPGIRTVLNATGVVLHTNLGRAPLAEAAQQAVAVAARGYGTVEIHMASGQRGERLASVKARLAQLVGAEDAVVVNNNAAAVLLALTALARGRSVVVSRGELVEIGGSFRIPEVAEAGGARLIEVGATNRTRVADYTRALDAQAEPVAGILRVHRSNFRIVGFTELPDRAALAALAHARGLWLFEDLGSGNLLPDTPEEPTVSQVLAEGVDLVSFSGDKLLGGPQAGIVAGRAELIQRLRRHPLYRALRLDKLVLAALDATLQLYLEGREAEIPGVAMLRLGPAELQPRCAALRVALGRPDLDLTVEPVDGRAGAGALPELPLDSVALVVRGLPVAELAHALRHADPPVLARQSQDALLIDLRALLPAQDAALAAVLRRTLRSLSPPPPSVADEP